MRFSFFLFFAFFFGTRFSPHVSGERVEKENATQIFTTSVVGKDGAKQIFIRPAFTDIPQIPGWGPQAQNGILCY